MVNSEWVLNGLTMSSVGIQKEFFQNYSPNRFICRGSGGFGKRADYRNRPPRGQVGAQIRCKYQYKIDISSKTSCFLMVFDEKRDSS